MSGASPAQPGFRGHIRNGLSAVATWRGALVDWSYDTPRVP